MSSCIAFCFLTYDIIIRYDIWNKFFENIDKSKYIVFIHPKFIKDFNLLYSFPYNIVKNRVNTTGKYNITIVKATLQLLKESYIHKENVSHFIFLSQSCIPLYSFDKLYNVITSFKLSVISHIDYNKKERYNQLSQLLKKYINYNEFIKQQPNMILTQNDVKILINNDLTNHYSHMICPDEHYFINNLLCIFKKNIIKKQTHFCNNRLERTQALEFKNVHNIFIKEVRKYGFLFMRKIAQDSILDVNFLLDN
jgi:hypothetical protein